MADSQQPDYLLETGTVVNYNPDGSVNIITTYNGPDELPNVVACVVEQAHGVSLGTAFQEGDLMIYLKNYPDQINFQLNGNGELIMYNNTGDGSQFFIAPSTGDLMYNKITP